MTVTDSDANVSAADADTLRFRIAVTDATPTFGTATIPPQRYTQGVAVTTAALPAASGGEGTLAYTVSPGLPSGLTFDAATRVIAGMPLAAAPYALVATDDEGTAAASDDDRVSLAFTVAVANAPGGVTVGCADPDTATPALEVDEGRSGTCTAVLNARPTGDVTVTPSITHASPAGHTTDVTRVPSALTFGTDDWFTARTVTLRAGTDADAVNDTATLSFAVGGYGPITSARAVAIAVRDSETAGLTAAPTSLTLHSGGTATYTLKLDTRPTATVTVDVSGSTAFVTAAPSASTFTGSTWSIAQTVTVAATGVGTTTLTNTAAGGDYAALDTDVAVTVSPDPTLTIGDASVTEGDDGAANLTFTVTLSAASTRQVTVNYAEGTGGTATSGTDYTALAAGTLTFAAGVTSQTLTVAVTGDTTDEPDEPVVVTLSGATHATLAAGGARGTGTITDDDAAPTVTLAVAPTAIAESGGTATLNRPLFGVTTVTVGATAGSNAAAGDFRLSTAKTLTIAEWSTTSTGTMTITAVDNSKDEPNKTVTISGTATNSQGVTQPASVDLTITDDDDAPTVTLSLSRSSIAESGAPNSATVTASLDHPSSAATTVTVGATATGAGDFRLSAAKTLMIAAGNTTSTETVTITAVDNSKDEPNKTVRVSGTATNRQGITQPASVTLTITDDDGAPTLSIDAPSVSEGNSGAVNLTFAVTLSAASGKEVTVGYAEGVGGTATSGTDYTALAAGTLTFAAGVTSQTLTVAVTGGTTDEPHETMVVTLNNPGNATLSDGGARGTGTITDDDATPTVTLALSRSSIAESGTTNSATVTASLDRPSSGATTVTISAAPGATTGAGDFRLSSNATLMIAAGRTSSSGTVTVTAVDNTRDDANKSVTVSGTATNSQGITQPSSLTLAITDNDAAPALSINSPSVTEGNTGSAHLTFTVRLSPVSGKQVTVAYAEGTGGTATLGTDYAALAAGTLTFAAGATSQTVTVAVTGDTTDEPVVVTLSSPTHAALAEGGARGTGTITDDDDAPTVTLAVAPGTIAESGGTATLSHASSAATTVTVTPVSGLYTVGADVTIVIAAGSTANASDTATITAVDDATDNVTARSGTVMAMAQNSQGIGAVTGVALMLTDDEPTPMVALNLTPASIVENGGTTTVTARLSGVSSEAVTLTVSATAGMNAQAGDFTLSSARTLTLAAGATASTGTVTITATDDARDGPNKTVTVSATGTWTSGVATPGSRTLSVVDDDGAPSLSIDAPRVVEGNTSPTALTFTVRLSPASK